MPADTPDHDLTPEQHRRLGTDLFNVTWTLLEKPDRTPAEIDSMIRAAQGAACAGAPTRSGRRRPERVAVLSVLAPWGYSSAGRASEWHSEGPGFEPP